MENSEHPADRLGILAELQRQFAAAVGQVDPAAAVPWCGDWRVADLVEHLGDIHHWAAAQARSAPVPPRDSSGGLRTRYERAAAELMSTLTGLDPARPADTLVENGTVAFWHRRQLHETLVHLWDLRRAGGLDPTAGGLELTVTPALWADTVDEAVTVMHPRQVRLGRATATPVPIRFEARDAGRTWQLPAGDAGPGSGAAPAAEPTVTVAADAEVLALLLWGRVDLDDPRVVVTGDAGALAAVLADRFLP